MIIMFFFKNTLDVILLHHIIIVTLDWDIWNFTKWKNWDKRIFMLNTFLMIFFVSEYIY